MISQKLSRLVPSMSILQNDSLQLLNRWTGNLVAFGQWNVWSNRGFLVLETVGILGSKVQNSIWVCSVWNNVKDSQCLASVCCVIQGIYSEILVYMPGSRGLAQPTPDDTTPMTIVPSPTTVLPTIKGPPLSACATEIHTSWTYVWICFYFSINLDKYLTHTRIFCRGLCKMNI